MRRPPRDERICLSVSAAERQHITLAARQAGMTVGRYIASCALDDVDCPVAPTWLAVEEQRHLLRGVHSLLGAGTVWHAPEPDAASVSEMLEILYRDRQRRADQQDLFDRMGR